MCNNAIHYIEGNTSILYKIRLLAEIAELDIGNCDLHYSKLCRTHPIDYPSNYRLQAVVHKTNRHCSQVVLNLNILRINNKNVTQVINNNIGNMYSSFLQKNEKKTKIFFLVTVARGRRPFQRKRYNIQSSKLHHEC